MKYKWLVYKNHTLIATVSTKKIAQLVASQHSQTTIQKVIHA